MSRQTISMTLLSPFLTGNADAPDAGLDAILPRDESQHIIFAETILRGMLRDALTSMMQRAPGGLGGLNADETSACLVAMFGRKSDQERNKDNSPAMGRKKDSDTSAYAPIPSGMRISVLRSIGAFPRESENQKSITRIEQDDLLGSVKEGSLQKVEMIGGIGKEVDFSCDVEFSAGVNNDHAVKLIDLALPAICAIGTAKSAGFGRVKSAAIKLAETQTATPRTIVVPNGCEARLTLEIHGPLVISTERHGENIFQSSEIIPGGAIKAAFAEAHSLEVEEKKWLSEAVFTHAIPHLEEEACENNTILPNSIVSYNGGTVIADAATFSTTMIYVDDDSHVCAPPSFPIDWKAGDREVVIKKWNEKANCKLRLSQLQKSTLVRTAINYDEGSAKIENDAGQLFSYEAVLPRTVETGNNVDWTFSICTKSPEELAFFVGKLNKNPLYLGKLRTRSTLKSCAELHTSTVTHWRSAGGKSSFYLVLQTPAVMFDTADLRGKVSTRDAYQAYFSSLIDGETIELKQYFATQALAGGYLALRYRGNRDHYQPWMLSEPGSTFVIECDTADEDKLIRKLKELIVSGLPLPTTMGMLTWENCPFVPQNGYGQIIVNPVKYEAFSADGLVSVDAPEGSAV